jgi:hypothetical protein
MINLEPGSLSIAIDKDEANRLLQTLLSACPGETVYQVARLFIEGDAPYQPPGAIFNYAFVVAESVTSGTKDPIVGFRLLHPDEFIAAIRALYVEKFESSIGHKQVTSFLTPTPPAEDRR